MCRIGVCQLTDQLGVFSVLRFASCLQTLDLLLSFADILRAVVAKLQQLLFQVFNVVCLLLKFAILLNLEFLLTLELLLKRVQAVHQLLPIFLVLLRGVARGAQLVLELVDGFALLVERSALLFGQREELFLLLGEGVELVLRSTEKLFTLGDGLVAVADFFLL